MPARGRVVVKYIETEERFPGSLIVLPDTARERLSRNQMEIVSVGEPEACEYPDDCDRLAHHFESMKLCVHPIDTRVIPGAWVVVRPRCLIDAGAGLYIIKQTDVLAVFALQLSETEADRIEADRLTACKEPLTSSQA